MKWIRPSRLFYLCVPVICLLPVLATEPASAITVELAKKCRELAFEAYPPVRTGVKSTAGAEGRTFYNSCIANNGVPPQSGAKPGEASAQQPAASAPPAKPQR